MIYDAHAYGENEANDLRAQEEAAQVRANAKSFATRPGGFNHVGGDDGSGHDPHSGPLWNRAMHPVETDDDSERVDRATSLLGALERLGAVDRQVVGHSILGNQVRVSPTGRERP